MHKKPYLEIAEYQDFLPEPLYRQLLQEATPVPGVPGLCQVGPNHGLETQEALTFLSNLVEQVSPNLQMVLAQRTVDRQFIDDRVAACATYNRDHQIDRHDPSLQTVLGLADSQDRIVFGPLRPDYAQNHNDNRIAPIPDYLAGNHVTLFGPPDSEKMCINAMNAYHRVLPNEPPIVAQLLTESTDVPRWGADNEDSKTPLRSDLVSAGINLSACFDGSLAYDDPSSGKHYALAQDHLAQPIKRFPGLAIPSPFLFFRNQPVPLHLYDFALHLFRNWQRPEALVFYVPKLENEEEAAYVQHFIHCAETLLRETHPEYALGTIRLMIVLENPRAILRVHEIIDALHPYFVGASLGWHDYLASTARLFKHDPQYRIPVKADPGIVIKYIKASHDLLADVVGPRGGIKVGGMYGVLPARNENSGPSFQVTMQGFIRDVVTQLKRGLNGFWVAHPDFVRLGMAWVAAWQKRLEGDSEPVRQLVDGCLEPAYRESIHAFIESPDIEGLDKNHPRYPLALIVADLKESEFIANNDPQEIRYNVFQSLQYLADWLSGNGCVALPAEIQGEKVRVMDDLATAERSRWEVWHEIHHGRFPLSHFIQIVFEEMRFIRKGLETPHKQTEVRYTAQNAKWYDLAVELLIKLMSDPNPPEFASALLLPCTTDIVRQSANPFALLKQMSPEKYGHPPMTERLIRYFEACGSRVFAETLAQNPILDEAQVHATIQALQSEEWQAAADFHGDIGQKKGLDPHAQSEQAQVSEKDRETREQLAEWGARYRQKFGFKFLVSAQGKSGPEMLAILQTRFAKGPSQEVENAKTALAEIACKRLQKSGLLQSGTLVEIAQKWGIQHLGVSLSEPGCQQSWSFPGQVREPWFQIASLSKSVASAFAQTVWTEMGFSLDQPVFSLLERLGSPLKIANDRPENPLCLRHLLNHQALNLHYVNGFEGSAPRMAELLEHPETFAYEPLQVIHPPDTEFSYSGGGYLLLQYLLETQLGDTYAKRLGQFLTDLKMINFHFDGSHKSANRVAGHDDQGYPVPDLVFPAFAAGAIATPKAIHTFLSALETAFHDPLGCGPISHDQAIQTLYGQDLGCFAFMGCRMGLGVFVAEAGPNRWMLHQGANEGYRALFLHCFDGPDRGKGMVLFATGEQNAVQAIAEIAQNLLQKLAVHGIDFSQFGQGWNNPDVPAEQRVNQGYKALVLDAFQPDLPEPIRDRGPIHPLSDLNLLVDARCLSVSNQKFARVENLVSPFEPTFDPSLFGRQGKVMDSWETVRHNPMAYDECIWQLARPTALKYVRISTQFHLGNQAPFISLEGRHQSEWFPILDKLALSGHAEWLGHLKETGPISQVRVRIWPDGGLTRLGLYAELPPNWMDRFDGISRPCPENIPHSLKPQSLPIPTGTPARFGNNLADASCGARILAASNEHYGPAAQILSPHAPLHMFDGLESARSREPNHHEWVEILLCQPSLIDHIDVDFHFFRNNNPQFMAIEAGMGHFDWTLCPRTWVKPYAGNLWRVKVSCAEPIDRIRLLIYPDGGLNRIRVYPPERNSSG